MTSEPPADLVRALRAAGCVFAEDEARLLADAAEGDPDRLAELRDHRIAGDPLEHLVGWVDFAGLRLKVGPGVFVPRQRSALLVAAAVAHLAARADPVLVDLCCGSGAVAAAIEARIPDVRVYAADVDEVALGYARRNLGSTAYVVAGDLYQPVPDALGGGVDVIVAVPPYVPTAAVATMPREARDHEPREALDGGTDGLDLARRITSGAGAWLAPGGAVMVEVGRGQAERLADQLPGHGLEVETVLDRETGGCVLVGRVPAGRGQPG